MSGTKPVVAGRYSIGGNQPEIDLAGVQPGGAGRRQVELDVEESRLPLEPVDQRPGVQERDRADADACAHRAVAAHRPSRSTGVSPAGGDVAPDFLGGDATRAERRVVQRRHAVEVVGADAERDLRQLGPVARSSPPARWAPSPRTSRASATVRTSSKPVVGVARSTWRGSGATAVMPPTASARRRASSSHASRSPAASSTAITRTPSPAARARATAVGGAGAGATNATSSSPAARSSPQHVRRPGRSRSPARSRAATSAAGQRPRPSHGVTAASTDPPGVPTRRTSVAAAGGGVHVLGRGEVEFVHPDERRAPAPCRARRASSASAPSASTSVVPASAAASAPDRVRRRPPARRSPPRPAPPSASWLTMLHPLHDHRRQPQRVAALLAGHARRPAVAHGGDEVLELAAQRLVLDDVEPCRPGSTAGRCPLGRRPASSARPPAPRSRPTGRPAAGRSGSCGRGRG